EHMGVPYTDALALETLTIRSGNNRLVLTKNSALISYNDQIILLPNAVLREDSRWLVPLEFLTLGLTRLTGTEFRYRPGTSRIFADNVDAPELEMNAQTLGPITRLTIRCGIPLNLDLKRDNQRAVLAIDRSPLDPVRERLDHRDRPRRYCDRSKRRHSRGEGSYADPCSKTENGASNAPGHYRPSDAGFRHCSR